MRFQALELHQSQGLLRYHELLIRRDDIDGDLGILR